MKLIKPSVELLTQKPDIQGIYEQIEKGCRVCYKSEDKIQYDEQGNSLTAENFVDNIINVRKHRSVAEHGTVYLQYKGDKIDNPLEKYRRNPYSKVAIEQEYQSNRIFRYQVEYIYYVTTNYRVLVENDWLEDLDYMCEPTKFHEKRVSFKIITSNSIMRELTRHRSMSFSVESTRYCNYSKNKFNNEITFIQPYWYKDPEECIKSRMLEIALNDAENSYLALIKEGAKPQEAREVLPLATKTELVMTGLVSDWKHFLELRCAENAHPDIQVIANAIKKELIDNGYIKDEEF